MAGLDVWKIFLVLGALTRHGFGATLDLTVTPTKTSPMSQEDVFISCRPGTGLQAIAILFIKITKSGDSSPLASVYQNNHAVVYNPNTTSEIKAVGQIESNALLESYLTITLEDPTYEQSGSYECELTYVDMKGQFKIAKNSGDVKVVKPDIHSIEGVIKDLREELRETKAELNNQTSSQAKVIKDLEKKIEANAQNFESVTKELNKTKAELNNQTSSQAKVIKDLEKKIEANAHNFESGTKQLQKTEAKLQKKKEMNCPNKSWTRVSYNLCYKGYKTYVSWYKATETCRKEGGTLVRIHSGFHNDLVYRFARSAGIKNQIWTGLNDIAKEGWYVFANGTFMYSYINWHKGQPDDTRDGTKDCVFQWLGGGSWYVGYCSSRFPFVCQTSTRSVDFW